jgi:outer membrane protein
MKNDFETRSADMNEGEKARLYQQMQQGVQKMQQELLKGIAGKIDVVAKEVAVNKGLAMIVHKGAVVFGGEDIRGYYK